MESSAVRVAVKFTRREVAAVRAALRHVQQDPAGPSELARIELDGDAWLADADIDSVIAVLASAGDVIVIALSGAALPMVDAPERQLLREAHELLNDPDSRLSIKDWNREARKLLRGEGDSKLST